MTIVVTAWVQDGVAMSADSRTSGSFTDMNEPNEDKRTYLKVLNDSTEKLLVSDGRLALGFAGGRQASLPIPPVVSRVLGTLGTKSEREPETVARKIYGQLRDLNPRPDVEFILAGYDANSECKVFCANTLDSSFGRLNEPRDGKPCYGTLPIGNKEVAYRLLSGAPLDCNVFTLQDAVDFSRHVVRTVVDHTRFLLIKPTVGGPIDTLVITAKEGVRFIRKKELNADFPERIEAPIEPKTQKKRKPSRKKE